MGKKSLLRKDFDQSFALFSKFLLVSASFSLFALSPAHAEMKSLGWNGWSDFAILPEYPDTIFSTKDGVRIRAWKTEAASITSSGADISGDLLLSVDTELYPTISVTIQPESGSMVSCTASLGPSSNIGPGETRTLTATSVWSGPPFPPPAGPLIIVMCSGGSGLVHIKDISVDRVLDLSVSDLKLVQNDKTVEPGGNVAPGKPLQVSVPVSGSGFNSPEIRTATVTLKAGSQAPMSKIIKLADAKALGTLNVDFEVNFDPSDSGLQTVTATVDPGNVLSESNFTNNSKSVQVNVLPQYKLKVSLPDTPASDQTKLNPGLQAIMPMSNYGGSSCSVANLVTKKRNVFIQCVDSNDNPLDGCTYSVSIKPGKDNGGHDSSNHIGNRPLVEVDTANGSRSADTIPVEGATVAMIMPEIAGDVEIVITGTDGTPDHHPISADPLIFEMKVKELVPIAPIGVIAPGFINFVINSHKRSIDANSVGSYATPQFAADIRETVSSFQKEVQTQTGVVANPIVSTGGSLFWGGLFDVHDNWQPDHCGHRDGRAMDISWKALSLRERAILAITVRNSETVKFYSREAPGTGADHWHLMPK